MRIPLVQVACALEWALCLNRVLLTAKWPQLLDTIAATQLITENGRVIFRGLRAAIGICADFPSSIVLHGSNGRADYFGVHVNRAARVFAGACGGQILGPTENIREALDFWCQMRGGDGRYRLSDASNSTTNGVGSKHEMQHLRQADSGQMMQVNVSESSESRLVDTAGPDDRDRTGNRTSAVKAVTGDHANPCGCSQPESSEKGSPIDANTFSGSSVVGDALGTCSLTSPVIWHEDHSDEARALAGVAAVEDLLPPPSSVSNTPCVTLRNTKSSPGARGCEPLIATFRQNSAEHVFGSGAMLPWKSESGFLCGNSHPEAGVRESEECARSRTVSNGDVDDVADTICGRDQRDARHERHLRQHNICEAVSMHSFHSGKQGQGNSAHGQRRFCNREEFEQRMVHVHKHPDSHNKETGANLSAAVHRQQPDDLETVLAMMIGQSVVPDQEHLAATCPNHPSGTGHTSLSGSGRTAGRRTLRSHRLIFSDRPDRTHRVQSYSKECGQPVAESSLPLRKPCSLDVSERGLQPADSHETAAGTGRKPLFSNANSERRNPAQVRLRGVHATQ